MAKEDHISVLPASLIQHILSLLPSTNEAIQTTVVSKSFHNQWAYDPILKLYLCGMSPEKFTAFIDNMLLVYDCSKIHKLYLQSDAYYNDEDPDFNWNVVINFAINKQVEELNLEFKSRYTELRLCLPETLFYHASLVKLRVHACNFLFFMPPNGSITWGHLKALNIERCTLPPKAIQNILYGSPSLESLEITDCVEVADDYGYPEYKIASESLKKLVLKDTRIIFLEISCPNLEELMIFGDFEIFCPNIEELLMFGNFSLARAPILVNPSLICATLDFECNYIYMFQLVDILRQLHRVKELKFGSIFIQTLSFMEKLGDNCSEKRAYNWFMSHLKNLEITGLSDKDDKCKLILNFIEVLLKKATLLEKLVVILKGGGDDFVTAISQKLLNYPRSSEHALVELLCPN